MTTKVYKLTDLEGEDWLVAPGDVAHPLLDRLAKLGWEPRLPARVLATGVVTEEDIAFSTGFFDQMVVEVERGPRGAMDQRMLDTFLLDAHRTLRQLRYVKEGAGI